MEKSELRQHVRRMKQMFGDAQLAEFSESIIRKLRTNPAVVRAKTILMYYSLYDEVDTHTFIDHLAQQGKEVLLPVVVSNTEMELRRYTGTHDLRNGFFDIMEPVGDLFTDYDKIDVAVVPGMAFDSLGNRLGRGKGYYDRLLPQLTNTYKIGVCFPFQRVPAVPADKHDVRMDEII